MSPPPPTDKYQTRARSPSPSPSAPPRSPAPWPRSGPGIQRVNFIFAIFGGRRPLFVPSPCVQCRYLRLSWVGSGLFGSMFVVMAKCMLRDRDLRYLHCMESTDLWQQEAVVSDVSQLQPERVLDALDQ